MCDHTPDPVVLVVDTEDAHSRLAPRAAAALGIGT